MVDPVVLVVSELVTNAVRYGRPPISMELRLRTERVRLAVHDGNSSEPVSRGDETEPDAESGRGMGIVAAVADEVIVEQVPDDGKIIRAVFDIRPPLEPYYHDPVTWWLAGCSARRISKGCKIGWPLREGA